MIIRELIVSPQERFYDYNIIKQSYSNGEDVFFDIYEYFYLPAINNLIKNLIIYESKLKKVIRYL